MPPQDTALGSEIYIHGGGVEKDWTRGCVALEDSEMLELFETIPHGTRVMIEK
jgi:L,D-peptidoglycan transpeptidase YkuD (ErfK/YbiS/YcfS/YnhG family)